MSRKNLKLYIHYRTTNRPWGGVNSFMKAFARYCALTGIQLAGSVYEDFDILFFSGPYKDKKHLVRIRELEALKKWGVSWKWMKYLKKTEPKLMVYRCDGFRDEYAELTDDPWDMRQKECLRIADMIVFQSEFCLRSAQRPHIGYCRDNYTIIHNGVNQELFRYRKGSWDGKRRLRFFSAIWSSNLNKGYSVIAAFSRLDEVEVTFCGQWPETIAAENVRLLPPRPQSELAREFVEHDVFLHPSYPDASPNVCLEAVSCGLPILFHPQSGIQEIAGDCGIPLEGNPAETVARVKKDYRRLIEKVRERKGYFSMERCGEEYIMVFERLLEVHRGR